MPDRDHAPFLKRHGFPVAVTARLTAPQRDLLLRYGYWLEALTQGAIDPLTAEQEHFVRTARGDAAPETPFELAWMEHRRALENPPAVPEVDIAQRLARVEAARLAVAAATEEYDARRAAILQSVQAQLDALETDFGPRLDAARLESEQAEAEAKSVVLAYGASFKYGRVQAVYARGRVTWDAKGLTQYMEVHPELGQFRRVGPPSVSFRLKPAHAPD